MEKTYVRTLKYSGITLGVMLVTALVLVQPIQAAAEEIRIEITPPKHDAVASSETAAAGVPEFQCDVIIGFTGDGAVLDSVVPDGISQNTVRNGNIIKTIHAEKERHHCFLEQGDIPVIVDVTIIGEIYEDVSTKSIISKQAIVVTCVKEEATGVLVGCKSETPATTTVPVGNECLEVIASIRLEGEPDPEEVLNFFNSQQEMNTVNKGSIVKTVESQKEVFACLLPALSGLDAIKKVDQVIFTEIWEDLDLLPDPVVKKEFLAFRCVTALLLDLNTEDQTTPASVESCQFITIQD